MTKPRETREAVSEIETEKRKSGSMRTGKRCCGKNYPKRNAGRAATG